jgi:hypothetical protein
VGRGGNMASDKEKSARVNVTLSLEHLKRFIDALPPDAMTDDLVKKKENAKAALEYLAYFFDSKLVDVMDAGICGPKPYIPDLR